MFQIFNFNLFECFFGLFLIICSHFRFNSFFNFFGNSCNIFLTFFNFRFFSGLFFFFFLFIIIFFLLFIFLLFLIIIFFLLFVFNLLVIFFFLIGDIFQFNLSRLCSIRSLILQFLCCCLFFNFLSIRPKLNFLQFNSFYAMINFDCFICFRIRN